MVHVPVETRVTVFPETVQMLGVVDEKLSAKPELAVAGIGNGGATKVWFASAPKAIVCGSRVESVKAGETPETFPEASVATRL
jgi:hypothetical protein